MSHRQGRSHIECFTDGAVSNNGNPNARGGFGIHFPGGEMRDVKGPLPGPVQTNNRAEYHAIIEAQNRARSAGYDSIKISTDSQVASRSVNEWLPKWKENGFRTSTGRPVADQDLLKRMEKNMRTIKTEVSHVRGHGENASNKMADSLARQGRRNQ
ncbi:unnamed protein product [Bursaphelenchus xylophilus]|uniref:ribonuclease H n=1 Tax=Bursaphelenchus xylophilus TaxID=6326 RepID=A0A1I7S912_BURXY|nr:unnamed protein product [Bursaphelenchus xylophilus]CAG9086126.1 unnamed protein product [Bursaphelenchus xylophilus]